MATSFLIDETSQEGITTLARGKKQSEDGTCNESHLCSETLVELNLQICANTKELRDRMIVMTFLELENDLLIISSKVRHSFTHNPQKQRTTSNLKRTGGALQNITHNLTKPDAELEDLLGPKNHNKYFSTSNLANHDRKNAPT